MPKFSKPIKVKLLDEATSYSDQINEKINDKFFKSFEKVESGQICDWFRNLEDEIWEFRERDTSRFYRFFAFWDSTSDKQTLIVGTHRRIR